jgi:putative DNA primase/helicase
MSFSNSQPVNSLGHPLTLESFSQKMKEVQKKLLVPNMGDYNAKSYRSMHEHALNYANIGFSVIPLHYPSQQSCSCRNKTCSSIGKHPITRQGLKEASCDVKQISEWWDQFPMANIGLLTGTKGKVAVLDIDQHSSGFESLKLLEEKYGKLPNSQRARSGGGGLHIYFLSPDYQLKNRVGLLPGLDIRGDDGYIVAPPSVHSSGQKYTWIMEGPLEPLPEWLFELVNAPKNLINESAKPADAIKPGRRNHTLASIAGLLRSHGLELDKISKGIHALNKALCEPCLPDEEVTKIASSISRYEKPEPWPMAKPLPITNNEAQELTADYLPACLREWLLDVSERMQIPLEFIAVPAIVAAASLVGRKLAIRPDSRDSWSVIPNLWGFIVADPGSLKSPAIAEAMRPLETLAKLAQESFKAQCRQIQIEDQKIKSQIETIKDSLKTDIKKTLEEEALQQRKQLMKLQELQAIREKPIEKRYKTNDPTPEKLAVILQENPRGILLLRDELSGWLESFRQRGREGSREFYLEAWNGNSSFSVDRIGRGTIHIEALCLSIFGGIQPAKLEAYMEKTTSSQGDDGFLERFQLVVFPERRKQWQLVSRKPNVAAAEGAFKVFEYLDIFDARDLCADQDSDIPYLRFSPDAQEHTNKWRQQLESRLLDDDSHPIYRAHLGKYRSLMPSLALIFTVMNALDRKIKDVVIEEANLAIKWCAFLDSHAQKIYKNFLHEKKFGAQLLAEKIKSHQLNDSEKIRDIYRHNWRGLNTPEKLDAAIDSLAALGWVRLEKVHTKGGPSEVLRINPDLPI